MKIFITGGSGFIGRHAVTELLRSEKHSLLLLSRDSKRTKELFPRSKRFSVIEGDLADMNAWKAKVKKFKPEGAIHLAAEGIPDYGFISSAQNLRYGLELTEFLGSIGCKSMVTAGTCWEHTSQNAYAAAKNALREVGRFAAQKNGMRFLWGRIFFAYGPGQKTASLIPFLISHMKRGIVPALKNSDGANDFIFVHDVARALIVILLRSKQAYAVYDIGTGRAARVGDIADMIARHYNLRETYHRRKRVSDALVADTRAIRKELNWRPQVTLAEGIRKTLKEFE